MKVGKTFSFDAAHQLPNHEGKCRRLHGHTYKLEVEVEGLVKEPVGEAPRSDEGMVIDFSILKAIFKEHIEPLVDHQFLNETIPVPVTTCEMIATWIRDTFLLHLPEAMPVTVRLWETPTSYAEI